MDGFFSTTMPDSTSMCTMLLERAGVALVPGVAFGDDRCVRFSYALDDQTLMTALDLVHKALKEA